MKLINLFERHTAGVYINLDKTLYVMGSFFKSKIFNIIYPYTVSGACLISQVIYTVAHVLGIDPNEIVHVIYKKSTKFFDTKPRGLTLKTIFDMFHRIDLPILDKKYKLKLSVETYDNTDAVVSAVKSGQPVIFIFSTNSTLYDGIYKLESDPTWTGEIPDDNVIATKTPPGATTNHSILVVGYDAGGDLLIMRELKSVYALKGYLKISKKALDQKFNMFKFLSVVVDRVEEIK